MLRMVGGSGLRLVEEPLKLRAVAGRDEGFCRGGSLPLANGIASPLEAAAREGSVNEEDVADETFGLENLASS